MADERAQKAWPKIEEFMRQPQQQGLTMVSTITDYNDGQDSKLTLLCGDCQGNFTISWQNLRSGKRCNLPVCVKKRIKEVRKPCNPTKMWEKIESFFKEPQQKGLTMISTVADYKGQDSVLTVFCDNCKQNFPMSWARLNLGCRCSNKVCISKRKSDAARSEDNMKMMWENITDFFKRPENSDKVLISKIEDYGNQDTKLKINCRICGGNYEMSWQGIRAGKQCNLDACVSQRMSKALTTITIEFIRDKVLEEGNGDLLVSEQYPGYGKPLDIWCHVCEKIYPKDFFSLAKRGKMSMSCS